MEFPILSAQEFYSRQEEFLQAVDPDWDEEDYQENEPEQLRRLGEVLGAGQGRSMLDCSCGSGLQTIPLAKLGWQVTATDITEAYLREARERAQKLNLAVRFQACDMRDLGGRFSAEFDALVTCYALDNIPEDEGIRQAVQSMRSVLKPGGKLYLKLRNFDELMEEPRRRYEFKFERPVPHGKLYGMDDWIYESDTHVIDVDVFWLQDRREPGSEWLPHIFAYRRRALRRADLEALLRGAGFHSVEFLPQPEPWFPYEVLALK